jgi:hypothetical protein
MAFKDPHADISTIPVKQHGAFARWRKIKLTPISDRFWKKVDRRGKGECWPFLGPRNKSGYGVFSPWAYHTGRTLAHRMAWEVTHGKPKLTICHRCDNPPCCNPDHLFEGTNGDNTADCIAKGRAWHPRGEDTHDAILNESQVIEIRKLCQLGTITQRRIGILFGISKSEVGHIHTRRKWKHIP